MTDKIWFNDIDLIEINKLGASGMTHSLGIQYTDVGADYLSGTMPVSDKTRQPFGILHGGASVTLAESLGSIGANLTLDNRKFYGVGLEVNANHIRSVESGVVTGTARPLHRGRKTQVWEIKIRNDKQQLTCVSRLTVAILARK